MMYKSTKKLVDAIESEILFTGDQRLKAIAFRAKSDYYHDFFGEPATPEIELYNDFMALGHTRLAQRVTEGEFDATKEESDEWARSQEGQSIFKSLLKKNARIQKEGT